MLRKGVYRVWKVLCCLTTIDEQNEIEKQKARAAEDEEFHVSSEAVRFPNQLCLFQEWNDEYLSCCNLIHIKTLCRAIIFIKIFIFGILLLVSTWMEEVSPLVHFGNTSQ
jgi:hypothetical protein